jgi:hypothetical protein
VGASDKSNHVVTRMQKMASYLPATDPTDIFLGF